MLEPPQLLLPGCGADCMAKPPASTGKPAIWRYLGAKDMLHVCNCQSFPHGFWLSTRKRVLTDAKPAPVAVFKINLRSRPRDGLFAEGKHLHPLDARACRRVHHGHNVLLQGVGVRLQVEREVLGAGLRLLLLEHLLNVL